MKILISADIEGVAGVVHREQTTPGNVEYETARRLMCAEVNAAVDGAFAAGASEVLVNDSHGPMRNLLPDLVDPRARLLSGHLKPLSMLQGLDGSFDGVMLVGYHARAGAKGILAHTISGFAFADISINERFAGEAFINGVLAGALGVPVILVTGDDCLRAEVAPLFAGACYAEVKTAWSAEAATSLSPRMAQNLIRGEAQRAVQSLQAIIPLRIEPPFRCKVRLNTQSMADLVSILPGCERSDSKCVLFETQSIHDLLCILVAMATMAASLR
jgi:D-amino peptidase